MSTAFPRTIEYLSAAAPVSMGDQWFEIASLSHFWIQRRFDVLRQLVPDSLWKGAATAEVGCGTGLLQRQMEDAFGITVDGFDLNEHALRANVARTSRVCCYNIFDRRTDLQEKYDVILLFDVLEHIENTALFLEALSFHLKKGGHLIINVPADQSLYSTYDEAVGHVRRYSSRELMDTVESIGFGAQQWTYWGLPLLPLLHVRKYVLRKETDRDRIMRDGFKPPSLLGNLVLKYVSQLEVIPQHWSGSSLALVAKKPERVKALAKPNNPSDSGETHKHSATENSEAP